MRPVLALAALAALLLGALAACSDDDPLRVSGGDRASVSFRPQLNSFGASAMLPINLIRLTVEALPDRSPLMDPVERTVSPTDPQWTIRLDVPLIGGQPIDVIVVVELINDTDGVRTIEWSGQVGPLTLEPGSTGEAPQVEMFRGSRDNLSITAVAISGGGSVTEGDVALLRAAATGATGVPQFFWSSLDPTIAALDTAAADSAVLEALLPGVARIVVEAGPRADTLELTVLQRVTSIEVSPALDTLDALGAQRLFAASGLDPRGDTVPGVAFTWSSSDSLTARSLGGGDFLALATGTVTITAASAVAPGVTGTAELTVRQVPDSVEVTPAADTLAAGGTVTLAASAFDANDSTIAGAAFTWTTTDSAVATVDPGGVVTAAAPGTALIRASSGALSDSAAITVVAGAAATVAPVQGDAQAGTVGQPLVDSLVVLVEDALGNAVPGTTVAWTTPDGGSLSPASGVTDAAGRAAAEWTLGAAAGAQAATATVGALTAAFGAGAAPAAVDSVAIEPNALSFATIGESDTLAASGFDAFGNAAGGAPAWATRDATVASVSATGVVDAVGNGATWIVATIDGVSDSAAVSVAQNVATVVLSAPSDTLLMTDTMTVSAAAFDAGGAPVADAIFTWSSSAPAVASVDAAGLVTALSAGTAFVRAASGGAADSVALVVEAVAGVTTFWLGSAGSDWLDPANWSAGAPPGGADTVLVPAGAPVQPVLTAPDSIAGLIVEDGASLTLSAATLTVTTLVQAGNTIGGTGTLRIRDALVSGTVPSLEVVDTALVVGAMTVNGDLSLLAGGFLDVSFPTVVTGGARVTGDGSSLQVFDSLSIGGALQIGGAESVLRAEVRNAAVVLVGDSLWSTGLGLLRMTGASSFVGITGNARFESSFGSEGFLLDGTIEVGGDWHAERAAFHTPQVTVVFNGTSGPQSITHLDVGHDPGQGHFGPIRASNPDGVAFLTPSLLRGDLTVDAGVAVAADTLVIEGSLLASGDFSAAALTADGITASGAYAVDSTTYDSPFFQENVALLDPALPYATLQVAHDSAAFAPGPVAIAGSLLVDGRLSLAGRTTVGGEVIVENAGELRLGGNTLDVAAGGMSVGFTSGLGLVVMTQPTDSLLVGQVNFGGASTAGLMTDGVIVASAFEANGLAFHASGAHVVELRPLPGMAVNRIAVQSPSLSDGVGARFATLRIDSTAAAGLDVDSDVAALHFVTDSASGVTLIAPPGTPATVSADSAQVYGATLRNVPLRIVGVSGPLAIDNTTFEQFDDGTTQLDVTHDASQPFVFTNMRFDSLDVGATGAYLSATRSGLVDGILTIEVQALNVENGDAFTVEGAGVDVTWTNDLTPAPPGATISWAGTASSDWSDPANWDSGVAPAVADTVWVPAGPPNQPVLFAADTIGGLIVEDGAALDLQDTLFVAGSARAGNTISGTAPLKFIGSGVMSGTFGDVVVAASGVSVDVAATVAGDLTVVAGGSLTVDAPLAVGGSALVAGDGAGLTIVDSLDVAGAVQLGGAESVDSAGLTVDGTLVVGDSLYTTGAAEFWMMLPQARIVVLGNARFDGTLSTEGQLEGGTIEVAGNWFSNGDAFHARITGLVLNGSGVAQNVNLLNDGHGPGQGHFAGLTVLNPAGVVFQNATLVHGDLTTVAGAPISASSLAVEGNIDAGGDLTSTFLQVKGVDAAGVYNVATTMYLSEPGDSLLTITGGLPYQALAVYVDSAAFDGPATVSNTMEVGFPTLAGPTSVRLAGSLTVAGNLILDGPGGAPSELILNGNRVDVGGDLIVGEALTVMLDAADTLAVAGSASFTGAFASATTFVTGALQVGGDVVGTAGAFHLTGTNLVLNGDTTQTLTTTTAGPATNEAALDTLFVGAAPGQITLLSDVYLNGSVFASRAVVDPTQTFGLRVLGDATLIVGFLGDTLEVGGALSASDGIVVTDVVVFEGAAQTIPAGVPYDYVDVVVTGDATWAGPDSITGDLTVAAGGSLTLGGATQVVGDAVVQGALDLGSPLYVVGDFSTLGGAGGGTLTMTDPADSLVVVGNATFAGGSTDGLLSAGTVFVESAGNFVAQNDAFRSTGTALVMRGDTLFMTNAGPGAGQGQLADLIVDSPLLILDEAYASGGVTDAGPSAIVDVGAEVDAFQALLRAEGDILTPQTTYTLLKLMLGGSLDVDTTGFDVDSIQFTGSGPQLAPGVDPGTFDPFPYSNIIVTGTDVQLGGASGQLALTADVFVRGPGATLTILPGDNGFVGSLHIVGGDATTRVVLGGPTGVDSVVVATGVLDLNGNALSVNDGGFAQTALLTTGTGVVEMNDLTDQLDIRNGNLVFQGGSTSGLLTGGTIDVAAGGNFESVGAAFQSSGTALVMRGDTIQMAGVGPGALDGRLADLLVDAGSLTVLDTLFVAGMLDDINPSGSSIAGGTGGERVEVLGPMLLDSGTVSLNHLVLGDSLAVSGFGGFTVDTTEFAGSGQRAPVEGLAGGAISYDVLVISGDSVDLGFGEFLGGMDTVDVVVRGAGARAFVYSTDEGGFNSLVMRAGDATTRVVLMTSVQIDDSVHVESGVLDLNGFTLTANNDALGTVAFRTTGTGAIEMNQVFDRLDLPSGEVFFEGGRSVLDSGFVDLGGAGASISFHATGEAYHSLGTYTQFEGDSIVIVNGGPGPTQARFHALEFGTQDPPFETYLVGAAFVGDSISEGFGGDLVGAPGSSLTVVGRWATSITGFQLPLLVAFDTLRAGESSYDVAVTELAGGTPLDPQIVPEFQNLPFDRLLVTGDVRFEVDTMSPDTLARVIEVLDGSLTLQGFGGLVQDSLTIDGAGAFFDNAGNSITIGDLGTLSGALITRNGAELRMPIDPGFVTVNGPVEFTGGSTDGLLTGGTLRVRGDFYAENGAFQASGTHRTVFNSFGVVSPPPITLTMPTGGATAGLDHFNDLSLEWTGGVNVTTDLYALGDLSDNSDASSAVDGTGQTIFSDGWNLNSGLTVTDLTLNLDDDLNGGSPGGILMDGVDFGAYAVTAPRMVINHPGGNGDPIFFTSLDFDPTGAGNYIEATDSDGGLALDIIVSFGLLGQPGDWASRITEGVGVTISP